ncbi:MAG: helix-turn-helix transcriptional regulator [Candidatus Fermentibacter daniensis]|jgi:transcriptional regulator with XRE-family HTH domain|nr:helix-turn-helix transcriptional regulator [Candidatus Fermentibacter sp.]NLI03650.1 helix-turn-helix transcriptional regulator [Candidatus Fermentibacter daniensis]
MEKKELIDLGRRIRERRQELGFTQEEFSSKSGIDRSYLGGVERGERNITIIMLCRICVCLNCDIPSLTNGIPGK